MSRRHEFPVIGLSGYAGAGKDAAAAALVEAGWVRVSFADKLREFLYAVNPTIRRRWWQRAVPLQQLVDRIGWEAAKNDYREVRELLQRVGTDAGRRVLGEDVWVEAALRGLPAAPIVVTDTRFPNEASAVERLGGVVVRVERPGVGPRNAHVSERALAGWRFAAVLVNDADLATLRRRITTLAAGMA